MTSAPAEPHHFTLSEKVAILKAVAGEIWDGGVLAYRIAVAAGYITQPEESANMSLLDIASKTIEALLADKTWAQVAAFAANADKAMQSGDLIVKVVKDHGRNIHDDVILGTQVAAVIAPKIAAQVSSFLAGPGGGIAMALFTMWATILIEGDPIQPGHPAYNAPAGPGDSLPPSA